jgi:hypothetical protein
VSRPPKISQTTIMLSVEIISFCKKTVRLRATWAGEKFHFASGIFFANRERDCIIEQIELQSSKSFTVATEFCRADVIKKNSQHTKIRLKLQFAWRADRGPIFCRESKAAIAIRLCSFAAGSTRSYPKAARLLDGRMKTLKSGLFCQIIALRLGGALSR